MHLRHGSLERPTGGRERAAQRGERHSHDQNLEDVSDPRAAGCGAAA
jgi:hypothetical protein